MCVYECYCGRPAPVRDGNCEWKNHKRRLFMCAFCRRRHYNPIARSIRAQNYRKTHRVVYVNRC